MRREAIMLLVLLIVLSVLPASVGAQGQQSTYEDPEGLYTVPIPQGWNVTEQDETLVITGPEREVRIYILTLPLQETLEDTVSRAWSTVDPDFDPEPQVSEPPAPTGIDRRIVINYQAGERFGQAVGSLVEERAFVILIQGPLAAVQTRQAQVRVITNGFTITGLEEQDLSDVEPAEMTGAMLDQIERYTSDLLAQFEIPGASVAIVQEGEVIYTGGFGVLEVGGEEPVTPTTPMMIGSTGKSITTAMMASMLDDGLFNWDTPVVEILPRFQFSSPALTQQVTMRNLVCACSGVPRRDLVLAFKAEELTAEDVVESLADFQLLTDFGETFQYSNQMIAAGGYAAAAAAGAEFGQLYEGYIHAMNQRIFEPIGMPNTYFYFGGVQERSGYASPHNLNLDAVYEASPAEWAQVWQPVAPAAGPWSTAEDMGRYMVFQMQNGVGPDGQRIVSEENLLETREAQVAVSSDVSYGLGWFIDDYKGIRLIRHGGNVIGFTSVFGFLPEKELGVVVLVNAEQGNAFGRQVRDYIFDLAFDAYDQARDQQEIEFAVQQLRQKAQPPEGLQQSVDPERVQSYTGQYSNDLLGRAAVYLRDGRLMLDTGFFQAELLPIVSEGVIERFLLTKLKFPVEFQPGEAGPMQMIVGRGTQSYTFSRQEAIPAEIDLALAALSQGVRENVTFADLSDLEWSRREFDNASLGCPEPGRFYAQVITPGYQFLLTYAGTTYDYRVAEEGEQVILCDTRPAAPAPTPTHIVQQGTMLGPANNLFEQSQIYLVALGDAGRSGQPVGCDDSLVSVTVNFEPTRAPLTAALEELLAIDSRTYGQSGLYNAFYRSDLAVEGIDIEDGEALINLSGSLRPGGVCDEPRMIGQIRQTALQYDTIDGVSILLNGSPLEEAF